MSAPPEIPELAFKDPIAYSKTLPSIYHLSAPHGAITDDNHGAYVVIVAWIMLCFLSISVLTRLLTRTIPVITAGTDDILIGISMVSSRPPTPLPTAKEHTRHGTHSLQIDANTNPRSSPSPKQP